MDSGHAMEMRCALVLISLAASEGVFRIPGFKSAGSTVVPSHLSPADLTITKNSSPSDWHCFGCQQRRPIDFSFGEQCPCHAGQFVGQGHGYDVAVSAGCELTEPVMKTGGVLLFTLQYGTCPIHEQSSQIVVPALADPQQLLLAASGVLPWNQSQPGGEASAPLN